MKHSTYFNYIEEKLSALSYRIEVRGKINLLDLNIYSETFFAGLLNCLLGYKLKNINQIKQNTEGIDLVDEENKIVAQVSATCTKQKIEKSLEKKILKEDYPDYKFKFIAICGDADKLKKKIYKNPNKIDFIPSEDIYDIKTLFKIMLNQNMSQLIETYEFVKNELGGEVDVVKIDSNLASIINILAKEDLSVKIVSPEINPFEIEKKLIFNDLMPVQSLVDDYKIYYSKVAEKYKEFDKQGVNKSLSVLSTIRHSYIKLESKLTEPSDIFYAVIEDLVELIRNSKNYTEIPKDELELCVYILVVDAFIRCKIFKNPEGYNYVTT